MMKIHIWYLLFFISACQVQSDNSKQHKDTDSQQLSDDKTHSLAVWQGSSLEILSVLGYFPQWWVEGKTVLFTNRNYDSLWIADLDNSEYRLISNRPGIGYNFKVGKNQVCSQTRGSANLVSIDLSNGEESILNSNEYKSAKDWYQREILNRNVVASLSSDLFSIEISTTDSTFIIQPTGQVNYINTSISPDGQLVLSEVAGRGLLVSNLKGEIKFEIKNGDQGTWLSNQTIAYIHRIDDGMRIQSSQIRIMDITNQDSITIESPEGNLIESFSFTHNHNSIIGHLSDGSLFKILTIK